MPWIELARFVRDRQEEGAANFEFCGRLDVDADEFAGKSGVGGEDEGQCRYGGEE